MLCFAVPFTSFSTLCKNAGPNQHVLTFFHNFNLQGHILNTTGVALTMELLLHDVKEELVLFSSSQCHDQIFQVLSGNTTDIQDADVCITVWLQFLASCCILSYIHHWDSGADEVSEFLTVCQYWWWRWWSDTLRILLRLWLCMIVAGEENMQGLNGKMCASDGNWEKLMLLVGKEQLTGSWLLTTLCWTMHSRCLRFIVSRHCSRRLRPSPSSNLGYWQTSIVCTLHSFSSP